MSRKIKTLIIALVVLVLLGGGYYGSTVWQKKKAAASSSSNSSVQKLGGLDSSKLAKIEVPDFTLEKNGDAWALTSVRGGPPPTGIDLDQSAISNLTYSLASVYIDRVVDETPADLSVYGLADPSSRATVTDSDGNKAVYIRGDMTPSRSDYYVMQEGDPKVYSVSTYSADSMASTLDKIRTKSLFPDFDTSTAQELRIENGKTRIAISPKPESAPVYLTASFSSLIMTSPYKLPRGVDSQALDTLLAPLKNLAIVDFVEDFPSSLAPYGLDKPSRISFKTKDNSLDLLLGSQLDDGKYYAQVAGTPGVFTVSGLEPIVDVKPFTLLDKFALILNIDSVDHFSVTGGEEPISADIKGTGDDAVYTLNGKKADVKSFRTFYQAVIGLLSDAEYPGPAPRNEASGASDPVITIAYQLNKPAGEQVSITLIPYNRDFYALSQEGTMEFLISRNQVHKIYETADAMVYSD